MKHFPTLSPVFAHCHFEISDVSLIHPNFSSYSPHSQRSEMACSRHNRNWPWTPFDPQTRLPFAWLHLFQNMSCHQMILKVRAAGEGRGAETERWNFLPDIKEFYLALCLRCFWWFWYGPKAGREKEKLDCDQLWSSKGCQSCPRGCQIFGPISPAPMAIGWGLPPKGDEHGSGNSAGMANPAVPSLKGDLMVHPWPITVPLPAMCFASKFP